MAAYYNEINPFAAQWLRNLIDAGEIAPGIVDERSIEDVTANDLRGFTQCHFFAGIGVWSHALRSAGWPDNRPVWTASCPCQPFSAAGKGEGFADERHLWPAFYHLFKQCSPFRCFGEQVGGANEWFDLVQADLEALGYSFGLVPFAAAGVGAPIVRERAYWVACANGEEYNWGGASGEERHSESSDRCTIGGLGGSHCKGLEIGERRLNQKPDSQGWEIEERPSGLSGVHGGFEPLIGFWSGADWLFCRDGKWRPIESGTTPLAPGFAGGMGRSKSPMVRMASRNRRGRIEGYGNALNAVAATDFIRAAMLAEKVQTNV